MFITAASRQQNVKLFLREPLALPGLGQRQIHGLQGDLAVHIQLEVVFKFADRFNECDQHRPWNVPSQADKLFKQVALPTVITIAGNKIAPGIGDWYLARTGYAAQQTDEPALPDRPDLPVLAV